MKKFLTLVVYLSWLASTAVYANEIILGVHPYLPPNEIYKRFSPLAEFLSKELGTSVRLRVAKSYQEHLDVVGHDKVDIAFVGPATYVEMVQQYGQKPLLGQLEVNGKTTLQSVIVVREHSPLTTLTDLRGKRLAFGDKHSTTGYIVPRYALARSGMKLSELASHSFISSHTNVALGVLANDFDAGAVKSEVLDTYRKKGLRALATLPATPEHLFVARKNMPRELIEAARKALHALADNPQGKVVMQSITGDMTGIGPVSDSDYNGLRGILKVVQKADAR